MMEVEIRLASAEDAATLARLRLELRAASHRLLEDEQAFLRRCESWMRERLRTGSQWQCWIAERRWEVVGAVWVQVIEKIPNPIAEAECIVYLTNFYVREKYRDAGVGSQMLAAVLEWSKSKNAEKVILWPTDRSKAFYRRHGVSSTHDQILQNVL